MDDLLALLQWPAFAITVGAAWLVASRHARSRLIGFRLYMVSNALWAVWGWHTSAWALVALQACLAAMNLRGEQKNG
jgi:hypothetical protein